MITEFPLSTVVEIKFNANDILDNLTPLQVVQLIKELELGIADWEVAVLLSRHFAKRQILAFNESPGLIQATDYELECELLKQGIIAEAHDREMHDHLEDEETAVIMTDDLP